MATKAEQAPRANSAINGITSLSDSIRMAQNLQTAITSFASGDGLRILSQLTDMIPQLEKDSREKDHRINELTVQLATEKESHSSYDQKQLDTYNGRYDTWKGKDATLQSTMKGLQKHLQEKDTKITTLESEREDLKTKGRELKGVFEAKTAKLKEKEQEITHLKQQLQEAQEKADGHSEQLSKSQSRVTKLEASLKMNRIEHDKLKEESTVTKERLKEVLKFSAPLKDISMEGMANKLEGLWHSATGLVRKFFEQDLPDEMLQNDWDKLRDIAIFKHHIPLPHSNSDIAKEMRVATVLGILARLVDKYIFQPTYLLSEESGFRELLCSQATVDQRKERFARGTILSMFPEEQESNGKDKIGWVIDDLFGNADVHAILANEAVVPFKEELDSFLMQAQETWRFVQYSKQKLEPTFIYNPDADLHWHNLELQVADGKEGEHPVSPVTAEGLEDELLVIFPWVYLIGSETRPITTGTVLWKAQLRAATQEVRKAASRTPFEQQPLIRQRSRPNRSMSISGDGARGGPTQNRFLSKPVMSTYV